MDYQEERSNSDDDIFVKEEKEPKKPRKRAPRQMSDETRERMKEILAKGRETRLRNNELKKEALLEDKQRIKETLKSKLKEVKKQLKEELVSESIVKKKKQVDIDLEQVKEPKPEDHKHKDPKPEPTVRKPEPTVPKPEPTVPKPTKPEPTVPKTQAQSTAAAKAHRHDGTTSVVPEPKPEPIIVNPEPKAHRHDGTTEVAPKTQPKQPNQVSAMPKPAAVAVPKPNLTAEYMRKLRAAYNF